MLISDIDAIDREIIRIMQHEARVSYRDLGRAVGLSPNAAADRLRRCCAADTRAFLRSRRGQIVGSDLNALATVGPTGSVTFRDS
jgi:DNA-binding Lrp family transcriptional regulator